MAARRAVIQPQSVLRVGRTDRADVVIATDEQMSGVHMEIAWDGAACIVRDRKSASGTFLDGERVTEAAVRSGAWIRAGSTNFSLYIEEHTPPPPGSIDRSPEREARARHALEILRAEARRGPFFALLDAARDDRILQLLRESVDSYQSLYEGVQGVVLEEAAPYLVELKESSGLLARLVREGWGKSWGIYLSARSSLADARRHFRKLLFVKEEDTRRELYFRFYDPRVLRLFLPSANARQKDELFGDIAAFVVEGEDGEALRLTK